jgi:hypothetical protein
MDGRKPIDRLLRYERVLQTKIDWTPLDFAGKQLVELRCGPLLGWGPIAVYLGAPSYVCVEPRFQAEVLDCGDIWVRFFLPLHQQLEALFDRHIAFDDFIERVGSRIHVHTARYTACLRRSIPARIHSST